MVEMFVKDLKKTNLSDNTIASYKKTVELFFSLYAEITKKNLLGFKGYFIGKL